MEPLESHVLFVRNDDGQFEVGTIDQIDGTYVQTQRDTFFQPNWAHVVAVGPHVLFVRNDGRFAVGTSTYPAASTRKRRTARWWTRRAAPSSPARPMSWRWARASCTSPVPAGWARWDTSIA